MEDIKETIIAQNDWQCSYRIKEGCILVVNKFFPMFPLYKSNYNEKKGIKYNVIIPLLNDCKNYDFIIPQKGPNKKNLSTYKTERLALIKKEIVGHLHYYCSGEFIDEEVTCPPDTVYYNNVCPVIKETNYNYWNTKLREAWHPHYENIEDFKYKIEIISQILDGLKNNNGFI